MQPPSRRDLVQVDVVVCGDEALIVPHGDIDLATLSVLSARLAEVVEQPLNVDIDLGDVPFIDLGGVRLIAKAATVLARGQRRLRCLNPQPPVRRTINLLGQAHLLA